MRGRAVGNAAKLAAASLLLGCATTTRATEAASQSTERSGAQPEASTVTPAPAISQESTPAKSKWQFATIGYVWFAGAWGKTDVIGPAAPVDLRLPFGKVLKAFKFAFMGAAEARRDRLVILGDLTFIHLDTNKGIGIRDPDFVHAELDSRTSEITLLGGYRLVNKGPVAVDLLAGGRMNFFKLTLQLEGPLRSADGSVKKTWLDPIIAARIHAPLGGKWSLSTYGDLGGIIFGSDVTWQTVGTINYDISRKMQIGAGWRYYKVNYDDGDFLYNVHQSGPLITFRTTL